MNGKEIVLIDLRVYLGGRNAGMAEKLLYRPKVGSAFKKMSGKAVAERMRGDSLFDPRQQGIFCNYFPGPDAREFPISI